MVDGDGALSGSELEGLQSWQDNGDGQVQAGELSDLGAIGVDSISTQEQGVLNARGETLAQSTAAAEWSNHFD